MAYMIDNISETDRRLLQTIDLSYVSSNSNVPIQVSGNRTSCFVSYQNSKSNIAFYPIISNEPLRNNVYDSNVIFCNICDYEYTEVSAIRMITKMLSNYSRQFTGWQLRPRNSSGVVSYYCGKGIILNSDKEAIVCFGNKVSVVNQMKRRICWIDPKVFTVDDKIAELIVKKLIPLLGRAGYIVEITSLSNLFNFTLPPPNIKQLNNILNRTAELNKRDIINKFYDYNVTVDPDDNR